MSVAVELSELSTIAAARGVPAYLITTDARGPRVLAVTPAFDGDHIRLKVRPGTAKRVVANATVALLWPASSADPSRSLIVDAAAALDPDDVEVAVLTPTNALLHVGPRLNAAGSDG